ncbi:MAG: CHRD domain-containing protein, partial [Rhodothermales bacterium]
LLESPNSAPSAVAIISPVEGEIIVVGDDPDATLDISWTTSTDPDGDDVYYSLQSATAADFSDHDDLVVGSVTEVSISFADLAEALIDEGVSVGEALTVYFRINAHDGSEQAIGATRSVMLELGVFPQFMANLSGVNEVPPAMSVGSGTVLASLSGRTLVLSGSFMALAGGFTASHIHVAPVGVSGSVVLPLTVTVGEDGRSGIFDPDENTYDLDAVALSGGATADSFIDALESGDAYVNVHSSAYPGGEIRGQILSVTNVAPNASGITVPDDGVRIVIEGDPSSTGMAVGISGATDPDGDRVAYIYQMASDAAFENVVYTESLLDPIGVELTVDDLADIYDSIVEEVVVGGEVTVYHRVVSTDGSEWTAGTASSFILERQSPTDVDGPESLPGEFTLHGNYPNPFNPSTIVRFDLPDNAEVSISVFDALGREVMSVPVQSMSAGANRMVMID